MSSTSGIYLVTVCRMETPLPP